MLLIITTCDVIIYATFSHSFKLKIIDGGVVAENIHQLSLVHQLSTNALQRAGKIDKQKSHIFLNNRF